MKLSSEEKKQLARQNAKWPTKLVEVPEVQWPDNPGKRPDEVWRSRDFLALVYAENRGITRLSICRTSMKGSRWKDGISWDDLQLLKRECGFGEFDAVEVFPKDCDVVNVANMRHLWVMGTSLPFAWRSGASHND